MITGIVLLCVVISASAGLAFIVFRKGRGTGQRASMLNAERRRAEQLARDGIRDESSLDEAFEHVEDAGGAKRAIPLRRMSPRRDEVPAQAEAEPSSAAAQGRRMSSSAASQGKRGSVSFVE